MLSIILSPRIDQIDFVQKNQHLEEDPLTRPQILPIIQSGRILSFSTVFHGGMEP